MEDPCIVVIITKSIVTPYSNKNNQVHYNTTVSIQLTLYITYLNINSLAEYCTPKEHHTPFRMEDQEMAKSLLKQPETHCNERLPTALDVEGGMKKEKKDLRARIIKYLILRESPRTRKLQKILSHFPAILLLCLMTSSLYPKEALTLVTILIILTIVIIHRNQLQLKINNPY